MTDETMNQLHMHIRQQLGDAVLEGLTDRGELTIIISSDAVLDVMAFLHDDTQCQFKCLMDVCGVDYPSQEERFAVVYHLLSHTKNVRLRVKLFTSENKVVPSVTHIYPNAGWYEREVWDMYGVFFSGNPDLRRILTDYGFDGHPLRKDFPLTGYVEMRYDPEQQAVVYEPVELAQAYRNFDYLSPWEGASYVLPGDEKAEEGDAA